MPIVGIRLGPFTRHLLQLGFASHLLHQTSAGSYDPITSCLSCSVISRFLGLTQLHTFGWAFPPSIFFCPVSYTRPLELFPKISLVQALVSGSAFWEKQGEDTAQHQHLKWSEAALISGKYLPPK